MKVVISLNNRKLKRYLKECRKECQYIFFGEKKEDISQLLDEKQFNEIKIDCSDAFKDKFVEDYIDLIGKLGVRYDSIHWWVTGTSAKNQFASKFFESLFAFYVAIDKINGVKESKKTILIISPPAEIVSSIEKYCRANSIELERLDNRLSGIYEPAKRKITAYLVTLLFLYQTWKKIYLANKYLKKNLSKIQQNEEYYVLRSWFYTRSIKGNEYRDSFFGILPDYIIKKGKKLIVIAGIWEDYSAVVKKIAQHSHHLIIPQELLIQYADALRVVVGLYLNRIKIENVDFSGFDVSDILRNEIDNEFNGTCLITILRDYLHYYYIKRLASKIKIKTFTTTYENYPWEKICFITLRKYSPETKIIGYQHAPLSKASLAMRLSNHERDIIPMPDKIVTIGNVTKTFLETVGNYEKNMVEVGCALRFERHSTSKIGQRTKSYKILLVLRGIPSVVIDNLNFVYKALKDNGKYKLIIRAHPALPPEKFKHLLAFNVFSCKNFSISTNTSVEKDLKEVDIVLYDASAVAIEALMMGIPVVNIALNAVLSADPLFQCKHFRWAARREEDLSKMLEAIYNLTDEEYYYQQKKAREFIGGYVSEVTDAKLDAFI